MFFEVYFYYVYHSYFITLNFYIDPWILPEREADRLYPCSSEPSDPFPVWAQLWKSPLADGYPGTLISAGKRVPCL